MTGPIGILVNPASGKDVRRLVARASVFDNQEKCAIVQRALAGAVAAGVTTFRYMDDTHGIARTAMAALADTLPGTLTGTLTDTLARTVDAQPVPTPDTSSVLDTIYGARALRDAGCAVVIVLGGDGTNRAFAKGWRNATLMPISTGTNNVFPRMVEGTIAGAAAALVASGRVDLREGVTRTKSITVLVDGEADDLALIDAVVTNQRFIGARALLESDALRLAVLTRGMSAAVGITSVGGLVAPMDDDEDAGLVLELGTSKQHVLAPLAPGMYQQIGFKRVRKIAFGELIKVRGPCTLAFDGERERTLQPGQYATFSVARDGPGVIDVDKTLRAAARQGLFVSGVATKSKAR